MPPKEITRAAFKPRPNTTEKALADVSAIYASSAFPEYNPDIILRREGWGIYGRMMRDEQVKAVVHFRRDAISARDWYFSNEDLEDLLSEDEIEFRIKLFTKIVTSIKGSFKAKLDGILTSIQNGFSITEKVYSLFDFEGRQYYGIQALRKKPFSTFYFYLDPYGRLKKFEQQVAGQAIPLDIRKFIHYVQNPEVDEYYGRSDLNQAHRSWYYKDAEMKMEGIYIERMSGGFVVMTPDEDMNLVPGSPLHNTLQDVLTNLQTSTGIIAPPGIKTEIHYPTDSQQHQRAIDAHDVKIAKALLTPNTSGLTPQQKVGSFARSQTDLEMFVWSLDAEADRLSENLNEQLFSELASLNFEDGLFPKFRLKPLSDSAKEKIVKRWSELVGRKAVTPTDADEAHLRDMLEMPSRSADEGDSKRSLDPQQTKALKEIIFDVQAGRLEKDTAVKLISASFPMTAEEVEDLLGNVTEQEPNSGEGEAPVVSSPPTDEVEPEPEPIEQPEEEQANQTIIGNDYLQVLYSRAVKRVDFAAIDHSTRVVENTTELPEVFTDGLNAMVDQVTQEVLNDPSQVDKIRMPASNKSAIRKEVGNILRQGWRIGESNARREVEKGLGDKRAIMKKIDYEALGELSNKYLQVKQRTIAGNISQRAQSLIYEILLQSIKSSWTIEQTKDEIYKRFASEGMISEEQAIEALGEALDVENPEARLNTIVRTNQFDAVNEARYDYFKDDALGGFVEGFEYSAVLDDRTTEICSHLGGAGSGKPHIHSAEWEGWDRYRPPNHYNCRSLLIPLMRGVDDWEESGEPTVAPQQGFG